MYLSAAWLKSQDNKLVTKLSVAADTTVFPIFSREYSRDVVCVTMELSEYLLSWNFSLQFPLRKKWKHMNVAVWKYKCGMVLIYNKYIDWVDWTCLRISLNLSHWPDNVTIVCVGLFIKLIFCQTVQLFPSIKCAWRGCIQNCFCSLLGTVTCLPRNTSLHLYICTSLHVKKVQ